MCCSLCAACATRRPRPVASKGAQSCGTIAARRVPQSAPPPPSGGTLPPGAQKDSSRPSPRPPLPARSDARAAGLQAQTCNPALTNWQQESLDSGATWTRPVEISKALGKWAGSLVGANVPTHARARTRVRVHTRARARHCHPNAHPADASVRDAKSQHASHCQASSEKPWTDHVLTRAV